MKKQLMLSLILGGLVAFSMASVANAATSATQTVNAGLAIKKSVVGKNTGLSGTIDPDLGSVTAMTPSFIVSTNSGSTLGLHLSATAPYNGATPEQALTSTGTYIVLANITAGAQATQAAIQDITGGTLSSNANAIAFPFTPQATVAGTITLGTWDNTGKFWPYTLTHKGDTDVNNGISGTALGGTYTTDDEPGTYQATVTLAFFP